MPRLAACLLFSLLASCAREAPRMPPQPTFPPPAWVPPAQPPAPEQATTQQAPAPAPVPTPHPVASPAAAPVPTAAELLARDREARTREAMTFLGDKARVETVAEVFVLIGAPGYAAFPTALELARKAADAYFNGRIKTHPARAIPVYLFGTTRAYHAFCVATEGSPCVSDLGFYDPQLRRVLVNAQNGLGSLTHEMMHPLIETDFPQCPDWFNEGVASLFGKAVFPRPGEVHGAKNWRLPQLKKALASPQRAYAGIDQLFGMSDDRFRDANQGLHYAMARYLCQWLDERGQLWPFYQRWRDRLATDPSGESSFAEITGKTPAAANPEWVKWVQGL